MLLELTNIVLQQGEFCLRVPQLSLQAGRRYLLRGENGSGKSTLLRLLALLQAPQSGELRLQGVPVDWRAASLPRLRQQVTLVEQSPWLFAGSVEKNLAFGLKLRGLRGTELQRQIDRTLEIVGLAGFQRRKAKQLSGGESRRVALARALCLQPQLLLLDEPTANLDSAQVAALEKFLVELPQRGMTLVIASHDHGQAQRIGAEEIELENGRLRTLPPAVVDPPELKVI